MHVYGVHVCGVVLLLNVGFHVYVHVYDGVLVVAECWVFSMLYCC